jgi:protein-disulfide isomerase
MVFGPEPGCVKCKKTADVAQQVAGTLGINMAKYDVLSEEADTYGIMLTPAVVFKGEVLVSGKVPTFDSLKEMVEERM